jgi:hypothetical protein
MKKIFLTTASCVMCLLMSCKDTSTTTDAITRSEKNKENTNAVLKGIETGDMGAMDSFEAHDLVDHGNGTDEVKGLDSIKKMLADIHNHVSNLKINLIANAIDGDYEFSLMRMTGTTVDTMMGMPPNTPIDRTWVGVLKMVNGLGKEHWRYEPK